MEEVVGVCTLFLQKLNDYLGSDTYNVPSRLRKDLEELRAYMKELVEFFKNEETWSSITNARKIIYGAEDEVDKIMVSRTRKWVPYTLSISSSGNLKKQLKAVRALCNYGEEEEATTGPKTTENEVLFQGVHMPGPTDYEGVEPNEIQEELQRLLLGLDEDNHQRKRLRAVFITGMAGMGKTFLVRKVWDQREVNVHFSCCAWVSDASSLELIEPKAILGHILNSFYDGTAPFAVSSMDVKSLVRAILSHLKGKRFLLVLDNVQDIQVWKLVAPALPRDSGGRVILITRKRGLELSISGIACHLLPVGRLSDEDAWDMFCRIAPEYSNVPDESNFFQRDYGAKTIVRECDGVPLSIATVAAILSDSTAYYHPNALRSFLKKLRDNRRINPLPDRDIQSTGGAVPALVLSYKELSFQLKYVLLYCCLFPQKAGDIQVRKLIRLCVAEGFVEDFEHNTAEEIMALCLQQLINLKLIINARTGYSGSVETISVGQTMRDFASDIVRKAMFREFYHYADDTRVPPENVRRLFITKNSNVPSNKDEVAFVRSCFVSDIENSKSSLVCQLLVGGLKLLRVLDLKGMKVCEELVHHLGDLIHLRYLGLRATTIKDLPASLSNLHNLQILDIRETQVSHLPGEMTRHGKFRHVLLAGSFSRKVVEFPWERKNLRPLNIQTLAGVKASIPLIEELQHWTRLQKLSIGCVQSHDFPKFCAAIKNMQFLRSLTIKAYRVERLPMEALSDARNHNLDTLKVGGPIVSLSYVVQCFSFLSRLYLWDSMLDEDPFLCLEGLSGLVVLCLSNAYIGKKMICNMGWFPKLKKLSVLRMKNLDEWKTQQGKISSLENLFIGYCPNLKAVPHDITDLCTLQVLQVSQMPQEFTTALQEKSEVHFRVHNIPQFVHAE